MAAALALVLGVGSLLYPPTAAWFSQRSQSRVISQGSVHPAVDIQQTEREQKLADARAYNDALASGAMLEANVNVPTGDGAISTGGFDYYSLLNTSVPGMMGRFMYDELDIDLPVYHGTSDETLLKGVGHLEGTSLPVGGIDSRSVLTAHRGLAQATMFTNLDKAELGDTFVVDVHDEVLTSTLR